jgi:hypothetical protein
VVSLLRAGHAPLPLPFFSFLFFFPVFLAFLCILGLFFFSFRRLEFWVFMVGLGLGV